MKEEMILKLIDRLMGENNESESPAVKNECAVEVGQAYFFRTVTHIEIGRVEKVIGKFAFLKDAGWIADTGRYSDFLKTGKFDNRAEFEPYPGLTAVNLDSMINFVPWPHDLPRDQK